MNSFGKFLAVSIMSIFLFAGSGLKHSIIIFMEFILISGIPRAKAIPFADATPILNPVNEPGPEQTATALSS